MKKILKQFLVFALGGLLSAMVDVGTVMGMLRMAKSPVESVTIGFSMGLLVNYFYHVYITFSVPMSHKSAVKYALVVIINYALTLAAVWISQGFGLGVILGKIISLPIVAVNGYILSRIWVFKSNITSEGCEI